MKFHKGGYMNMQIKARINTNTAEIVTHLL